MHSVLFTGAPFCTVLHSCLRPSGACEPACPHTPLRATSSAPAPFGTPNPTISHPLRPPHRSLALAGTLVCVAVGAVVLGRFRRSLRGAFLALRRPDRSDPGPLPRFLSARPALQVETFQPSPKKTGEGTGVPLLNLLESCRGPIYYHRPAPDTLAQQWHPTTRRVVSRQAAGSVGGSAGSDVGEWPRMRARGEGSDLMF